MSARAAARHFEVSASASIKLVRRWRQTGSYVPARPGGGRRRVLSAWDDWLRATLSAEPDITLAELQGRLADAGVRVSLQTINTTLRALGYSYKKNRAGRRTGAPGRRPPATALA